MLYCFELNLMKKIFPMVIRKILLTVFLLVFATGMSAIAQMQVNFVAARSFVKNDSIMIRWAPSTPALFRLGVENGYKITRTTIRNGVEEQSVVLAEQILHLGEKDSSWKQLIEKNNSAALLNEFLFLPDDLVGGLSPEQSEAIQGSLFGLVLLSCDYDVSIAKAAGLYFADKTVKPGETYRYKIELAGNKNEGNYAPAYFNNNSSELSVNPEISNLEATFKNKVTKLSWNTTPFLEFYGGYNVERSTDNKNFSIINKAPLLLTSSQFEKSKTNILFIDTMPKTGIKYYYRIRGINFFGEMSDPSNMVEGTGFQELTSFPVIDSVRVDRNSEIYVHWQLNNTNENKLVKKYALYRAEKDNGDYSLLLEGENAFTYTDKLPKPTNFYKVAAIAFGDDTLYSFSVMALIIDTIPPTKPTGVEAVVDTNGIVSIKWKASPDSDVEGYKVFRANSLNEEFVQINQEFAIETAYSDTINLRTLSKNVFYAIAATDHNYNNSLLSNPIAVRRPDTIAPVEAIVTQLDVKLDGIHVQWIPSTSDDVSVSSLIRFSDLSNDKPDTIFSFKPSESVSKFADTLLVPGNGYYYAVVVFDSAGNYAVSNKVYQLFESGFRKKIAFSGAEADREKKNVTLKWQYAEKDVEKFVIYRSGAKSPMTAVAVVPANVFTYTDTDLHMGNVYEYRIKAVFSNGAQSIISDPTSVEY